MFPMIFEICIPKTPFVQIFMLLSGSAHLSQNMSHNRPTILSVFSHVSCQFVFAHIFLVVVNPSPSRPPPSSLPRYDHAHYFSSSLLLICPYQFNRFCLRNVDIWHTLASSCMIWFLTWSFLVLSIVASSFLLQAISSRLSF